jgi:hypothetical protein
VQVVDYDAAPHVLVELRAREFGPVAALSFDQPEYLDPIIEGLAEARRRLVAAKVALVEQVPA